MDTIYVNYVTIKIMFSGQAIARPVKLRLKLEFIITECYRVMI